MEAELQKERRFEEERNSQKSHLDMETPNMGAFNEKDDVKKVWRRGTEGLVELGKIPGVLAKLERAEKAVEIVKGM